MVYERVTIVQNTLERCTYHSRGGDELGAGVHGWNLRVKGHTVRLCVGPRPFLMHMGVVSVVSRDKLFVETQQVAALKSFRPDVIC